MLFRNPRKWAYSAVGTWWRFAAMAVANTAFLVNAVVAAAESGLRSGLLAALLPLMFQLAYLYALRGMLRPSAETQTEA